MSTLTAPQSRTRTTSYGARLSVVLVVAFALSAGHTVYAYVADLAEPGFTVTSPAAWLFYAAGFSSAALARKDARWAQLALLAYLGLLLVVAVFYYPTTFDVHQQTVFGWFENDVYTGLLMLAAYLGVERLRAGSASRRLGS